MKFLSYTAAALLVLVLASCEKKPEGPIDPHYAVPLLASATLNRNSIDLDADSSGAVVRVDSVTYRISIVADGVIVAQPGDPPANASVTITLPGQIDPAAARSFAIHHTSADSFEFAGTTTFTVHQTDIGLVRFAFKTTSAAGFESNLLEQTLLIGRLTNHPPHITATDVPDTVTLPPNDSLLIVMTATVADSDGLGDINDVWFYSLNSTNPTQKFHLYDDGSLTTNPPSGDTTAADGVYTITVKLVDSPTVRRTFQFEFHAVDKGGRSAVPVTRSLTVK